MSFTRSDSARSFSEDEDIYLNHDEAQIHPYMFEPVTDSSDTDSEEAENTVGMTDQARLNSTDWCKCGSCQALASVEECRCCRESARIVEKMEEAESGGLSPVQCITQHPGFQDVCCNIWVLQTAYFQYRQEYGERDLAGEAVNRRYRYTAYRQFVRCWGYLGRRVRVLVPLPACAVTAIRAAFPSEEFAGFKYPTLQKITTKFFCRNLYVHVCQCIDTHKKINHMMLFIIFKFTHK